MYQHQQNLKPAFYAICYSDIFDYPLNKSVINQFAVGQSISSLEIDKSLKQLQKKGLIFEKDGYFFLRGKERIVKKLKIREKISKAKVLKAKKIIKILQNIPTVKLIGVSGSLALNNAKKEDDIDLFFISKKNTMWLTRLFVLLVIQILGVKREKNSLDARDKICANMFLDESNLVLPKLKQNLYTAHEVVQMKPLFEKDNMHSKFLLQNKWVKVFLPNAFSLKEIKNETGGNANLLKRIVLLLEEATKNLQLFYMKKNRTTELITPYLLAFHPQDMQEIVLKKFQERIKKYGI